MKIGIFLNYRKKDAREIFPELVTYFRNKKVQLFCNQPEQGDQPLPSPGVTCLPLKELIQKIDFLMTLGGDGTILKASRFVKDGSVPVIGVHMGGMGFLAELSPENLFPSLEQLLNGNYTIFERMMIKGKIYYQEETREVFAINDLVIDKGRTLRMLKIRTFLNDEYLHTYRADGLIIATPTGSTAYSLSSGGPILTPDLEAMVITPISPHSLTARPVVVPSRKKVQIVCENSNQEVFLISDGQEQYSLSEVKRLEITRAPFTFKTVKITERSFFETLRIKLNWGRDIRGI